MKLEQQKTVDMSKKLFNGTAASIFMVLYLYLDELYAFLEPDFLH